MCERTLGISNVDLVKEPCAHLGKIDSGLVGDNNLKVRNANGCFTNKAPTIMVKEFAHGFLAGALWKPP